MNDEKSGELEALRKAIARAHRDLAVLQEKPWFAWRFGVRDAMDRLCRVMVRYGIERDRGKP